MVNFKTMDDIERDKEIEQKEKFKKVIVKDLNDVMEQIFPKKVKKKLTFLKFILSNFALIKIPLILACAY